MTTNKMDIQKFYGVLAYYPMTFLSDNQKLNYRYNILQIVEELMRRRPYGDYSKYFLYLRYRALDHRLNNLLRETDMDLLPSQREYIVRLINLTTLLKRVIYHYASGTFPKSYIDLTTENLQKVLDNYTKTNRIHKGSNVIMLQGPQYVDLAESLWPEAEKYYYSK